MRHADSDTLPETHQWLEDEFPFGMAHFQGRTVSFRECSDHRSSSQLSQKESISVSNIDCSADTCNLSEMVMIYRFHNKGLVMIKLVVP